MSSCALPTSLSTDQHCFREVLVEAGEDVDELKMDLAA